MLRLSLLEFLFRCIPESFLLILANCILYNKGLNKKNYFISSIILALTIYLSRMLPIHFGVHSIISMVVYIIVSYTLNKIPINKSILFSLIVTIIITICEFINIIIIEIYSGHGIEISLYSDIEKVLIFLPSLILFAITIFLLKVFVKRIKRE